MTIKVVIVEDNETWRFVYRRKLRGAADIEVIGEFDRGEEALVQIPHLNPGVVVVDVSLPGMSGFEFAEKMKKYPDVKVMLATSHAKEYLSQINPDGFNVFDKGGAVGLLDAIRATYAN